MKQYSDDLKTSGGRLAYLFKESQYNLDDCHLRNAIRKMYDDGILEYSAVEVDKTDSKKTAALKEKDRHEKDITNTYNQIIRHLNNKSEISPIWLKRYHAFFNCTSDFLLGLSDNAFNDTGLNDIAIKNLRIYNQDDKEILNALLTIKRGMTFRFMLRSIKTFLHGNYRIPIQHKIISQNKDGSVKVRQNIIPTDSEDFEVDEYGNKTYYLHLQDDELKENNVLPILIDDNFVESIALKMLDSHLVKFKEQYEKYKK